MDKFEFKTLRSQFRKIEHDAYYDLKWETGGKFLSPVALNKLTQNENDFSHKHNFDFSLCTKPNYQELAVSMKIVRWLDYPEHFFNTYKYN